MSSADSTQSGAGAADIAIIGMAARFPMAANVEQFWQNLRDGVECITFFSDDELAKAGTDPALIDNPSYVKARGRLADIDRFDAGFFGYSPREAEITDPQQRLFLECAWQALELAGYSSDSYAGRIGVYAGSTFSTYLLANIYYNPDLTHAVDEMQIMMANDKDYLSTRVSYKLNLRGPSMNVQTACSTSLVAIHLACQSLLNGECDLALVGGVSIGVPQERGYIYREGGIRSPDGHCRAFDADARGTVSGSGVGVVVLKPLERALADGDSIDALIKGSALNNDGALKIGYTAPSIDGQAEVIAEAQAVALIDPATIGYIETHGTGTQLGDPIEIAALIQVFGANVAKGSCAIGSVKTNIGHLDAAAGIAGLIKAVLALKHRVIPPSLHFQAAGPDIDFANSPFYVNTVAREWPARATPRRAGVSSFGIGGTNAHVVLEEAPSVAPSGPSRPWQLLLLSARSASALETATTQLAERLKQEQLNLADVAYTLQLGRKAFSHRRIVICQTNEAAVSILETHDPIGMATHVHQPGGRPLVFMFPGQGAQYINMGAELYRHEPLFRTQVDRCAELLLPHLGLDLRDVIFDESGRGTIYRARTDESATGTIYRAPTDDESDTGTIYRAPTNDESTDSSIVHRPSSALPSLDQTWLTQPALFVVEYALAKLWMAWGVRPWAMIGHSLGEHVAACLAGVFSLEDALALVAARGRLMQSLPVGAMLAVPLPAAETQALLGPALSLAAINGPSLCVVSGPLEPLAALEQQLAARGVNVRRLHTTHAFHSTMLAPIVAPFLACVKKARLKLPNLPFISNITGSWISAAAATDPNYWAQQLLQPVQFGQGLAELAHEPERVLLEVGPGRTLSTLTRQVSDQAAARAVLTSLRHPQDQQPDLPFILTTLGKLWLVGVAIDWPKLYTLERRRRVPLPTYPFERRRYWVEMPQHSHPAVVPLATPPAESSAPELPSAPEPPSAPVSALYPRPELLNPYVAPSDLIERQIVEIWQEVLGIEPVGIHDNFFELGGHSLMGMQVIAQVRSVLQIDLPLSAIFETPTVAGMAAALAQGQAATSTIRRVSDVANERRLLDGLDQLSEADVDALLNTMLAEEESTNE